MIISHSCYLLHCSLVSTCMSEYPLSAIIAERCFTMKEETLPSMFTRTIKKDQAVRHKAECNSFPYQRNNSTEIVNCVPVSIAQKCSTVFVWASTFLYFKQISADTCARLIQWEFIHTVFTLSLLSIAVFLLSVPLDTHTVTGEPLLHADSAFLFLLSVLLLLCDQSNLAWLVDDL